MSQLGRRIEVNNVWKVFGDRPEIALRPEHASKSREEIRQELGVVVALRDVSFAVSSGEVFVVMGLSGSGKSTLVRCLIRLTEASAGQIYFDGEDIGAYSLEQLVQFRRKTEHAIAVVGDNGSLLGEIDKGSAANRNVWQRLGALMASYASARAIMGRQSSQGAAPTS